MVLDTKIFTAVFATLSLLPSFSSTAWAQQCDPQDKCGSVFNTSASELKAGDAYACLLSTPFNRSIATDSLTYWTDTLQFQSTLAYLKDPPPGYQQNSVDLLGGFELIQDQIDNGVFSNQYAFEAAVHSLLQRTHDSHIAISGGVFDAFSFTPDIAFASVSLDGFSLPKVYNADDLYDWQASDRTSPPPSIAKVNGQLAEKFFADHGARNSYGSIEPHGDWNQIMWSFAAYIQGYTDPFSTPFYPGDSLTIEYANGTVQDFPWLAAYVGDPNIPFICTGQDMYDWFVLGLDTPSDIKLNGDPATMTATSAPDATATDDEAPDLTIVSTAASTPTDMAQTFNFTGWGGAYPENPDVVRPDLGDGSFLTGYFLQDKKIGVLSIPTFAVSQDPDAVRNFSSTIREFLTRSKDAGMIYILIDLQQNYGGEQLLAQETFRQFFPDMNAYEGMRTRSFDLTDKLGTIMTNYWQQNEDSINNDTIYAEFTNDPWAVTNEINAGTNQNFTSWQEYFGPHPDRNDAFSTVFRYNFTNPVFEYVAGDIDINDESIQSPVALYEAKDIVILTDGICASTCDLFMEMMHHQAGVRTVAVGGLPQEGPMQARGSVRGALALNSYVLDGNLAYAASIDRSIIPALYDRTFGLSSPTSVLFNFADQIRENEYIPLQFVYEAADCRIFYTPDTYFDYVKLWEYAASAALFNASTCVAHSAEHNNTMQTDAYGPSAEQLAAWAATNPANAPVDYSSIVDNDFDFNSSDINFWIGLNEDMTVERYDNGFIDILSCNSFGANCQFIDRRPATAAENQARQPLLDDVDVQHSPLTFAGQRSRTASRGGRTSSSGYAPGSTIRGTPGLPRIGGRSHKRRDRIHARASG